MKLSSRDARRALARPDPATGAVLLHGPDAMRIALIREDLVAALVGPDGAAEMRFTRLAGSDVRRDPAQLSDALRASGFFPGQRAVLLEDANDGLAPVVIAALDDRAPQDAYLIVTAGQLTARSGLRKHFESHRTALSLAVYPDPMGRDEIEAALARAGLTDISGEAMRALTELAQTLDPGDFRQNVEKLALYMASADAPATPDDIAAIAPQTVDAAVDAAIAAVAEGELARLARTLPRLSAQGVTPTTLCIALQRHFRALHAAAAHPQGPDKGLAGLRPPVFGPRRDAMLSQARGWGMHRLEDALRQIMDTDLDLRSAREIPARAHLERLMMRLAMSRPK